MGAAAADWRHWLALLGVALTIAVYLPYIRSILKRRTLPHGFTWLIWGGVTVGVFLAQLADGGGAGAWPIGVSGAVSVLVAILALSGYGDRSIRPSDWGFLAFGALALPAWLLTDDPLWAAVILTLADLAGFGPTFRKAWAKPYDEPMWFYGVIVLRNVIAVAALEHLSVTTTVFPVSVALSCIVFVAMTAYRRRSIPTAS